jgi:hypothetical protein
MRIGSPNPGQEARPLVRPWVIPFQPSAGKRNAAFRFGPWLYAELTFLRARGEPSTHRDGVPELQRLRADHAEAVLAPGRADRARFAASVSDRGDASVDRFAEGVPRMAGSTGGERLRLRPARRRRRRDAVGHVEAALAAPSA